MDLAYSLYRFEEFGPLTSSEREAVLALGGAPRRYERSQTIRSEGSPATGFYLLLDGWAMSSVTLSDGGRQIMKVHLPGDALGTPSMSLARAAETLFTVTPALVSTVSFERFGRLLRDQPRVGALFLLSVQRERVALMDRLSSIGRTSAESRLAALLIDVFERLQPLGAVDGDAFHMQLTQEQMGDVVGLTPVHVNRMLRALEDRGLLTRHRQRIVIRDRPALSRLAARPERVLRSDLTWLPPPT